MQQLRTPLEGLGTEPHSTPRQTTGLKQVALCSAKINSPTVLANTGLDTLADE